MIAFWTLVIGVIVGFVIGIGWAMRSAAHDLEAKRDPSQFPPATSRRIRRAQRAQRADLRAVLPADRAVRW